MNSVQNNFNTSFTGRCSHIKTAQNVCHLVNVNFPHISTTRLEPLVEHVRRENVDLYQRFLDYNPAKGYFLKFNNSFEKKIIGIFIWYRNMVERLNYARSNDYFIKDLGKYFSVLSQLRCYQLGNCYETAKISEMIMKMNGYKNACVAYLKCDESPVDHVVCVFNRDGSNVDKIINNKTIIIDPWFGCADFANNMFKKYKNMLSEYFYFRPNVKFNLRNIESTQLTKEENDLLKQKYQELNFKR